MKRYAILTVILLLATGCAASRGEGLTVGNGFINTGASQAARDEITRERTEAEIAKVEAETAMRESQTQAGIQQNALTGKVVREVLFALGIAAALAAVAIGLGYAGKQATPLASQGVAALEAALALRQSKRLEISLEIGADNYSGHLLAEGYTKDELADLVHQNPALDGPRVQQLQIQAGPRGMRVLADRGELEAALARLPIETAAESAIKAKKGDNHADS